MEPLSFDVVSIQSQLVYGCVGNNVALPTLTAAGLRVAAIPTVLLSNTPHYPSVHGGVVPLEWFRGYLSDLQARRALKTLKAILVGYLGSPGQAEVLSCWIRQIQAIEPDVLVVVDPVIGDHDHGIYVDQALISAYQQHLLPLATGITPNGFELAALVGYDTGSLEDSVHAARSLLTGRMRWVAITSAAPTALDNALTQVVVVTENETLILRHPLVAISPKGTGDLFTAELTCRLLAGQPLNEAADGACRHVYTVLKHTEKAQSAELLCDAPQIPHRLESLIVNASTHYST